MSLHIRRAVEADLPFLFQLERTLFPSARRESRRSIRRSVASPHQEVWLLIDEASTPLAAMTLRFHPKSLRIYSLAVVPEAQGKGVGSRLLSWAETRARENGRLRVLLEVDAANERLVHLYRSRGFGEDQPLPHYYGPGELGIRMQKILTEISNSR